MFHETAFPGPFQDESPEVQRLPIITQEFKKGGGRTLNQGPSRLGRGTFRIAKLS